MPVSEMTTPTFTSGFAADAPEATCAAGSRRARARDHLGSCTGTTATGGASGTPAASAAKPDVKVGVVISLTGVGNVYGPTQKNGVELAAQRINDAGGVNGAKLVLVIDDDQSTTDGGVTAFRKQTSQDRVVAILGPTLSNTAVAAHPVAQSAQTPVIAISNTGDGIVGKCDWGTCDYIFRASLGESTAIPQTVNVAKTKLNVKSVVLMYAQDDKFSSDGFAIFKKNLTSAGITIKKEIAFSKTDVDLSGPVTAALAESPDAIVDSSLAGPAIQVLKEVNKRKPGMLVIGGNGFNTPAIINVGGAPPKGPVEHNPHEVGGDLEAVRDLPQASIWPLLRKRRMLTQPFDKKLPLPVHQRIVDGCSTKIHSGHYFHGFTPLVLGACTD